MLAAIPQGRVYGRSAKLVIEVELWIPQRAGRRGSEPQRALGSPGGGGHGHGAQQKGTRLGAMRRGKTVDEMLDQEVSGVPVAGT